MGVLAKIDADAQQLAALKNSKIDAALRMKIAEDLVADKTEASKIGGLTYIMDIADESTAVRAIAQLGAINSDRSRRKLESYVGSAVGYVRAAVADPQRALGNPASRSKSANPVAAGVPPFPGVSTTALPAMSAGKTPLIATK